MSSTRLSRALAGLSNPFECRRFVVLLVLQPRTLSPARGLGSSQFARHYFGNLVLISSRRATEMFQFTRCPPSLPMCSAGGHQPSRWWGCPIRILKAHRLHAAPLERFAGLRVLLRSLAPRHPPRTLSSLFSSSSSLLGVHPDTWSVLSVCLCFISPRHRTAANGALVACWLVALAPSRCAGEGDGTCVSSVFSLAALTAKLKISYAIVQVLRQVPPTTEEWKTA